jgi:hypothetical protein
MQLLKRSALLVVLVAFPVTAAGDFPFPLQLRLAPEVIASRVARETIAANAPFTPSRDVAIGANARASYEAVIKRLTAPDSTEPEIRVDVVHVSGDLLSSGAVSRAIVEHTVDLSSSDGGAIAHWQLHGERAMFTADDYAMARAFELASDDAAAAFEVLLKQSEEVARWMQRRGVEPVSPRARWPQRGDLVTYLDLAGGISTGGDGEGPSVSARAGISGQHYMAQIHLARMMAPFTAQPVFGVAAGQANLTTVALGAEVGLVARSRLLELRAGFGAHWIRGHADMAYFVLPGRTSEVSFTYSALVPGVFAALQIADLVLPGGSRLRFALEARHYFETDVEFAELRRTVSVVDNSFTALVGWELPWTHSR